MTGLKRSLIYWGRSIEKFFLMICFLAMITAVFVSIINSVPPLDYILMYIPMTFTIALLSLAYTNITTALSHIISMGATRRDSFFGMQLFYHILMLQGLLVSEIVILALPKVYATDKSSLCMFLAALYIASCAMGNGISIAVMRCGMNTAKVIYIGALIVVCLFSIIIMSVSEHMVIPHFGVVSIIVAMVGVVLDILGIVVCSKAVKEYEVRV